MGCPECQPGDVEVVGPGQASCTLCGGGFVPVGEALRALRLDTSTVAGAAVVALKCPTCEGPFRELVIGGEPLYACLACAAVWAAPGALARAASGAPPANAPSPPVARAAPAPSAPPSSTSKRITSPPRAPAAAAAEPSGPAAARVGREPAQASAPSRPVPSSAPRVASGAAAREADAVRRAASWELPWRAMSAVLVVAALAPVAWLLRPIARVTVADQAFTIPWRERGELADAAVGDHPGTRRRWDHNGARLEVHYFDGAPTDLVRKLYGPNVTVADGAGFGILDAGDGPRVGRVVMKIIGPRTWVLSASAPDDGAFAAGEPAQRFLRSLP